MRVEENTRWFLNVYSLAVWFTCVGSSGDWNWYWTLDFETDGANSSSVQQDWSSSPGVPRCEERGDDEGDDEPSRAHVVRDFHMFPPDEDREGNDRDDLDRIEELVEDRDNPFAVDFNQAYVVYQPPVMHGDFLFFSLFSVRMFLFIHWFF